MRLQRRKSNINEIYGQDSTDWESYDGQKVFVDFREFGEGEDRRPYFRVEITWEDVDLILKIFAERKNIAAMRVKKALQLANAVENLRED